jgi:O-methyltransferase
MPQSPFQQIVKLDAAPGFKELFERNRPYTMLPERIYVENLELIDFFRSRLGGDLVECGTWKGGMAFGMMSVAGPDRHYHFFDSFQGLPPASEVDGESALAYQRNTASPRYYDNCRADEEEFRARALEQGVPAAHIHVYPGWFQDTLPYFPADRSIAVLRLDCDWHDSMIQCLEALYPRIERGGIVIIDDYDVWDGCSRAVHEFMQRCEEPLRVYRTVESMVAYLVKIPARGKQ